MILFVYLIGLFTSFFVGSVPVAVFILGVILMSFYEHGESAQMLIATEKNQ